MCKAIPSLAAAALILGCDLGNDTPLTPSSDQVPSPRTCRFDDVVISPRDGLGPVHRSHGIAVRWEGDAGPMRFEVRAKGHTVPGELIRSDRMAVWMPELLYPADAVVEWSVHACGKALRATFVSGALTHALPNLGAALGERPWAIDLRDARWDTPEPHAALGSRASLRFGLAPTFLVQLVPIDELSAQVVLAPGVVDDEGRVRQDLRRPLLRTKTSLLHNPYLVLPPFDVELALESGALLLTEADLILGATETGLMDGRLIAEVVVPGEARPGDARDPCVLLARLSDERCHPCSVGGGRCFTLSLSEIEGTPAEEDMLLDLPMGPLPTPTSNDIAP